MRFVTRRSLFGALAALALGASLATVLAMRDRATPRPTVTLQTASTAALASSGIRLSEPVGSAKIDETTASNAVIAEWPGSTVREAVLAQVDETDTVPPIHCLCWVVSIIPPGGLQFPSNGPPGAPDIGVPTYDIELIDASTGRYLMGYMGQ